MGFMSAASLNQSFPLPPANPCMGGDNAYKVPDLEQQGVYASSSQVNPKLQGKGPSGTCPVPSRNSLTPPLQTRLVEGRPA